MATCYCTGACRLGFGCPGRPNWRRPKVHGDWDSEPVAPAPVRQGWECPRCHSVMAPGMPMCVRCGPKTAAVETGGKTDG